MFSNVHNVFVQIDNCICSNWKNVFVQIGKCFCPNLLSNLSEWIFSNVDKADKVMSEMGFLENRTKHFSIGFSIHAFLNIHKSLGKTRFLPSARVARSYIMPPNLFSNFNLRWPKNPAISSSELLWSDHKKNFPMPNVGETERQKRQNFLFNLWSVLIGKDNDKLGNFQGECQQN